MMSKKNKINANFFQRLGAFLLDMFLVAVVASLLSGPFLDVESINKLNDEYTSIVNNEETYDLTLDGFFEQIETINYQLSVKMGVYTFILLVLSLLYFGVFQYNNKGQTLGKKIFSIRVVGIDNNEVSRDSMLVRALISNSILINILLFASMIFMSKSFYLYVAIILNFLDYLIIFISGAMVLFSKKRVAIHDLIAKTEVIKSCFKEDFLCES